MSLADEAGFTPVDSSPSSSSEIATSGPVRNSVPSWLKYLTVASLVLAGIMLLFPQYEKIGIEHHDILGGFSKHSFGDMRMSIFQVALVWMFLIVAMAGVWTCDRADQPMGRFYMTSIVAIVLAMIVVAIAHGTLSSTEWRPLEQRSWSRIYNERTSAGTTVWVGLCAGLLGAGSCIFYSRFYRPSATPSPRISRSKSLGKTSPLEAKLEEIDQLRATGKITADEYAILRQRIFKDSSN